MAFFNIKKHLRQRVFVFYCSVSQRAVLDRKNARSVLAVAAKIRVQQAA